MLALIVAGVTGCSKQGRKNRYLASADRDFQAGHYDRAEIEYLAVLRIPPVDARAVGQLGILYFNDAKFYQAYRVLKQAVELQPDNLEARAKLGLAYLALHSVKDARQQALEVLDRQPANRDALLLLADTVTSSNQIHESMARLKALPPEVKSQAEYHIARGTLWFRQLDLTNAEASFKQAVAVDPKSSAGYLALGNYYLLRNDLLQAAPALRTAAELAPPRSIAKIRYAEILLKTANAAQAGKYITELTEQVPDYLPAWLFLARVAWAERKLDDCSTFLGKVTARDPINYDALMMKGDWFLTKREGTNALAQFERLAVTYPRNPPVLYKIALANLANLDVNQALVNLNDTVASDPDFADAVLLLANLNIRKGRAAQAVASLTQLLQKQPLLVQGHLLLANAYLAQHEPDSAAAVYQRMLTVFPKSPESHAVFGAFLVQQGRKAEARQAFERSLELNPEYLPAVERLVDLDIQEANYSTALERVEKILSVNPGAAEPRLLLAKIHLAKIQKSVAEAKDKKQAGRNGSTETVADISNGEPDIKEAEAELLKAVELNPEVRTSYLMLAQLYIAVGRQQQALDSLSNFLAKTNDVPSLMQVGMIQEQLKNYAAARDTYEKLLEASPDFSPALNNLAYLYSEPLNDLKKAYRHAERARQLRPYDPSTADTLGWILYKRKEYERALGLIEEAADKIHDSAEIQLHLGMTHYMLGEEDPARLALEQAARSIDDFPGKADAVTCLNTLAIDPQTATGSSTIELRKQLQQAPRDLIALERLAAVQQRDGALDQALETCETALNYYPQNPYLRFKLAQVYASIQPPNLRKAFEQAKNAHNLAPEDGPISALLGRLAFQSGKPEWAASLLEESSRKLPGNPDVMYDLAWAYYSLGRVADALAEMSQAVGSTNALAATKLEDAKRFLAFVAAPQDSAPLSQLTGQAEAMIPTNVPAIMICARAQEAQGNYQKAALLYEQALSIYPHFLPATRKLAILYLERPGDERRAYDLATKARAAYPQDPELAKVLGVLTFRAGDYVRAAQLLNESAKQLQADGEAICYLGMAQYRLKYKAESKTNLERALQLNLNANLASEAKRLLAEIQ